MKTFVNPLLDLQFAVPVRLTQQDAESFGSGCQSARHLKRNKFEHTPIKKAFNQKSNLDLPGDLTVQEVAGTKPRVFGFDGYEIPRTFYESKAQIFHPKPTEKVTLIERDVRRQQYKPGPQSEHAMPHPDWRSESIPQKGRFGKYQRETTATEAAKASAKKPAPNTYNQTDNTMAMSKSTLWFNKFNAPSFIDEAEYMGQQTEKAFGRPVSYNLTSPRSLWRKIYPPKNPPPTTWKHEKKDGPGPGSYEQGKAHDKMVSPRVTSTPKQCSQRVTFSDQYVKSHKYIPGVGKYKEIDRGYLFRSFDYEKIGKER